MPPIQLNNRWGAWQHRNQKEPESVQQSVEPLKPVQVTTSVLSMSDQQNKNGRTAITEAGCETIDDKHYF